MSPTLNAGDFVVVWRRVRRLQLGDLVVCNHPDYSRLIKRINAIDLNGNYLLEGDNPSSLSPEKMGWLSLNQMYGKVVFTIRKNT